MMSRLVLEAVGREKAERLALLCGVYLAAAFAIGGLKYAVHIRSAGLGERMIRHLRRDIVGSRPASAGEPPEDVTQDQAGTIVTVIASEAEAVGKFVGDCVSTPIVQAGTLVSVLGYMLFTEPRLGFVVLATVVPQVAIVSGLDRVLDPWRELIAFVRSTSAAKVQFDLIEATLGRKL